MRQRVHQLRNLAPWERWLLLRLCLLLPAVGAALRLLGFRRTQTLLARLSPAAADQDPQETTLRSDEAQRIARLVRIASNHGPYRATCLRQSLMLWWLLRRRSLPAELRIGVRKDTELQAHAWVEHGGEPLGQRRPPRRIRRFVSLRLDDAMSGIFGLFNQDAAPVQTEELADMASLLERRGPDRTGTWHDGAVGLGHTLLATTPEAVFEQLPLRHAESGCVITADVRLDNRAELLAGLGIAERFADTGDAEIILLAYLAWGETCVERLLGDFTFAIWDPRSRSALLRPRPLRHAASLLPSHAGPLPRLRIGAAGHPGTAADALSDQRGPHRRFPGHPARGNRQDQHLLRGGLPSASCPQPDRDAGRHATASLLDAGAWPRAAPVLERGLRRGLSRGIHRGGPLPTAQRRARRLHAERRHGLRLGSRRGAGAVGRGRARALADLLRGGSRSRRLASRRAPSMRR